MRDRAMVHTQHSRSTGEWLAAADTDAPAPPPPAPTAVWGDSQTPTGWHRAQTTRTDHNLLGACSSHLGLGQQLLVGGHARHHALNACPHLPDVPVITRPSGLQDTDRPRQAHVQRRQHTTDAHTTTLRQHTCNHIAATSGSHHVGGHGELRSSLTRMVCSSALCSSSSSLFFFLVSSAYLMLVATQN